MIQKRKSDLDLVEYKRKVFLLNKKDYLQNVRHTE